MYADLHRSPRATPKLMTACEVRSVAPPYSPAAPHVPDAGRHAGQPGPRALRTPLPETGPHRGLPRAASAQPPTRRPGGRPGGPHRYGQTSARQPGQGLRRAVPRGEAERAAEAATGLLSLTLFHFPKPACDPGRSLAVHRPLADRAHPMARGHRMSFRSAHLPLDDHTVAVLVPGRLRRGTAESDRAARRSQGHGVVRPQAEVWDQRGTVDAVLVPAWSLDLGSRAQGSCPRRSAKILDGIYAAGESSQRSSERPGTRLPKVVSSGFVPLSRS